jgi:hypothetical protein
MNVNNTQTNEPLTSPFVDNLFIVNHKRRHKFLNIAKCGITTLKVVTAKDDGIKYQDLHRLHAVFGIRSNHNHMIKVNEPLFQDYVRVGVYRDPTQRFLSWYKDKVLEPKQHYIFFAGLAVDNSIDRTLEFLQYELSKSDPLWMDEHLRPQSRYYQPDDIDMVTTLSNLNKYLIYIGVDIKKSTKYNRSKGKIDLNLRQSLKIKRLYKDDYRLWEKVKHKQWLPSTNNY